MLNSCDFKDQRVTGTKTVFAGYAGEIKNNKIPVIEKKNHKVFSVKIPQVISDTSSIRLDDLVRNIQYIQLETERNSLIGSIDKLIVTDKSIIVCDFNKASSIFIFNLKGKFMKKIFLKGKGPGEFLALRDVTYNNLTKEILLYDDFGRKINYYSEDGSYIKSSKTYYYYLKLAWLEDGTLLSKATPDINLHVPDLKYAQLVSTDTSQSILTKAFSAKPVFEKNELNSSKNFKDHTGKVLFTPLFTDTIFEISSATEMFAKYHIDMGDRNIVKRVTKDIDASSFLLELNLKKNYYFEGNCLEMKNNLFFELNNGDIASFFYSSKTGRLVGGKSTSSADIDLALFSLPKSVYRDSYVSTITATEIIARRNGMDRSVVSKKKDNKTIKLINSIKQEDNPVLMFYNINEKF